MDSSTWFWFWLASLQLENIPEVDDVRPKRCDRCGSPARCGGRLLLHGHGCRTRTCVLPAFAGVEERVGECWERRYRCTVCNRVMVVLPWGVLPRYLYTVGAIVLAFFLVSERPLGDGLPHKRAYKRQGMYRKLTYHSEHRWRSLARWAALSRTWWPLWAGGGVPSLLVGFLERSHGGSAEAVRAAMSSHVRWTAAA